MNTMVCFRAAGAAYCLPVDNTRSVRRTVALVVLPGAGPDVAGIIPGDPPLTVISVLGAGGDHVLVVEAGEHVFGLQVDSVTGLRNIRPAGIRAAPQGQHLALISGTVEMDGELVMIADPQALAARL